jgi:hypothetical protein
VSAVRLALSTVYVGKRVSTRLGTVNLLRWLRRQLAQPGPLRERLEAAVVNDDPAELRRLLGHLEFGPDQRHHVEALLAAWEREIGAR